MGSVPVQLPLRVVGSGSTRGQEMLLRGVHVGAGVVRDATLRYVATGTGGGPITTTTKIGMASGDDATFAAREAETGQVHARRKFVPHMTTGGTGNANTAVALIEEAETEIAAGHAVVYSSKFWIDPPTAVPRRWSWEEVAAGSADAQLDLLGAAMAGQSVQPGEAYWAMHHEPRGDGDLTAWAAAQERMIARVAPLAPNWRLGVIINGFVFSAKAQGLTDAELAAAEVPQSLLDVILSHDGFFGADCYHGGTIENPGSENAGPKIERMSAWADRKGLNRLGIGETNGIRAVDVTDAFNAVLADPRYEFACIFNSSENNRAGVDWLLSGDRLAAFQAFL